MLVFHKVSGKPLLTLYVGFPESPRHLIEKDDEERAMSVLRSLHFDGTNDDWIQSEFNEIRQTILAEKSVAAPGWLIMFKVPSWRTRLMHGVAVQIFTQLTGISELHSSRSLIFWNNEVRCYKLLPNKDV